MHRFYLNEPFGLGDIVSLSAEESNHAIKVLRLNVGDNVEILNGTDIFNAVIDKIEKNSLLVKILSQRDSIEPNTKITLFQGLPKGDKIYSIVQKCTEVGVHSIVPVLMQRCVKKPSNEQKLIEKCQKTAIEACKQCGRNHIPKIYDICDLHAAIQMLSEYYLIIVPWEEERKNSLKNIVEKAKLGYNIAVFIGPEGGIDKDEIEILKSAGAITITLGRRILRTETAGECTSFSILSMLNDL